LKIIKNKVTIEFEETNDPLVTVSPQAGWGLTVLISTVQRQYGDYLKVLIIDKVKKADCTDAHVKVLDKGAGDYIMHA
jgi:citrate lyase gamma subunit